MSCETSMIAWFSMIKQYLIHLVSCLHLTPTVITMWYPGLWTETCRYDDSAEMTVSLFNSYLEQGSPEIGSVVSLLEEFRCYFWETSNIHGECSTLWTLGKYLEIRAVVLLWVMWASRLLALCHILNALFHSSLRVWRRRITENTDDLFQVERSDTD